MTHGATVLANTPPKRVKSPGPTVAMNRTAQLRIQKLRNDANGFEQKRSPFKTQTRQINNSIRSKIELFEKNEDHVKPMPISQPAVRRESHNGYKNLVTIQLDADEEKDTVVIVKDNVRKFEAKIQFRDVVPEVKKYETVNVPIRPAALAITVSPWTSSGTVVTDPDSKQAEILLAERRKLLENREAEVKTEVTLRPVSTDSINDILRESSGASLEVSFPRALDFAKHHKRSLWRDIRGIQELGLVENLSKEARTRQEAKFELMMSEATFLHSLNILNFHYMDNIKKHIPHVLSDKDYEILFKHAGDVRACSEAFLEALDQIWQKDPMLNNIYSAVATHTNEHFGPYIKYCRNMLDMRNHLVHLTTTNDAFKNLLDVLINREGAQKLSLDSFLTSPMQRITKLPLLMKTIMDKLEDDSEEYLQCVVAYEAVGKIASECDTVVTEKKQMEELLKLSTELEFGEDTKSVPIVIPGRVLVSRARVKHFAFRDKAPKREKLELVLFSDLLMVTKRKSDKLFIVVDHCSRDKLQLKEMDNPTLYGQGENSKQLKPVVITMLNNSQDKKLDLVVTFKVKEQCKEWLGILAVNTEKSANVIQVIALQEHEATEPDQLSFAPGDVIQLTGQEIQGWCEGELISDGQKGKFLLEKTAQLSTLVKTKKESIKIAEPVPSDEIKQSIKVVEQIPSDGIKESIKIPEQVPSDEIKEVIVENEEEIPLNENKE